MKSSDFVQSIKEKNLGETVFVIGGGPSLNKYLPDRSVLDGKNIITTNNAYQIFPNAVCAHFADRTWWLWHKDKLKDFKSPITTCTTTNLYCNIEYDRAGVIVFYHDERKGGITRQTTKLNGNNAGHQAVNIATHCGFKNIILLGFDMDPQSPTSHWHGGHSRTTNRANYKGTMIPGMELVVPQQIDYNFRIYNVNKESNLKCFEFTELEKWL